MAEQVAQDHRRLKLVVIGLGLALVVGFFALILGAAWKFRHKAPAATAPASLSVSLPADTRITSTALTATELALTTEGPAGRQVFVVDRRTGKLRQIFTVGP